ncbi:hypothetical protein C475_01696 [Halosimplex carlsbadense 2-9-1]|uniref:Uncharacterized protein n=1 Tax=Halosimplex carlsbadense 2-9-1 TaxID=797114 RepID=M0D4L3_9EURY|nr:hypothetical protein [Halosimplex carlsbadense]ELZ29622.1 hypothetical protein C475_01696 [Halosimplex carlsbadense 2-9-1]
MGLITGIGGNDREVEHSEVTVEREHLFDVSVSGQYRDGVVDERYLLVVVPVERLADGRELVRIGMGERDK